jgi:hypothetical protein
MTDSDSSSQEVVKSQTLVHDLFKRDGQVQEESDCFVNFGRVVVDVRLFTSVREMRYAFENGKQKIELWIGQSDQYDQEPPKYRFALKGVMTTYTAVKLISLLRYRIEGRLSLEKYTVQMATVLKEHCSIG